MNNVIIFPVVKRNTPPQNMEEMIESIEGARKDCVEYLIDEMMSMVLARCYDEGFDLSEDHCVKATSLVIEAMRAAMYKSVHLEHDLHQFAEKKFVVDELPKFKDLLEE